MVLLLRAIGKKKSATVVEVDFTSAADLMVISQSLYLLFLLLSSPFTSPGTSMRGKRRCTPPHYAAGAGDVDLCKRLIQKGAKASTWDFYQYSAVDYAKQSGATDCVAYLEEVSALGAATNAGKRPRLYSGFSVLPHHFILWSSLL